MYTESPAISGAHLEHDVDAPERHSSHRIHRAKSAAFRPSSGFTNTPAAHGRPSTTSPGIRALVRALGRFCIAIVIGVGATLAWQSYGGEMVKAWVPSLGWLSPASPSAELQAQVKPVALDLAIMRRSVEQLASNQDQLARKQDQMAHAFATLQSAVQEINQNILALAPLAPKAAHALPPKPPQAPAQ
jgi:hypothetical protein